ncbi:hypothetical protein [Ensifer adhaerens]|uniref:hypothetical protein n=1 Tax=Ensifer adhaerens TaxID=106592 RepID=UPI001177EE9E|nr:hypothetical protein [Ensifer adhaerens]
MSSLSSGRAWSLCCVTFLFCMTFSSLPDPRFAFAQEATKEETAKDQFDTIGSKREKFQVERGKVDEGNEIGKASGGLAEGNCEVGKALVAIVQGGNEELLRAMKSAASSYKTAIDALTLLTTNKRFSKKISEKNLKWLIQTQLFTDPRTQNDLLEQLLALTIEAKKAADRIAAGQGTDADLSSLIDASSRIPRMLMAFIDVVVTS